jgi:Icc-related predicted phosphoesterase
MPDIVVYATDLHGDIHYYEKLLEIASGKNIKAVIMGGDITPFLTAVGDVALYQREFLEFYLFPRLRAFRKNFRKDVFVMMGNDDLMINMDLMQKFEKTGIFRLINQKAHRLGKKYVAGYSYVNETPFLIKDWERPEERIKKDLENLAKLSDPKKTIYVMHAPPLGTHLDVIFSGTHVGSRAIREFIQKKQPYLTLHGHIHESCRMSGIWKDIIGRTVSVNPGKENFLVFDINDLKTMEILTV